MLSRSGERIFSDLKKKSIDILLLSMILAVEFFIDAIFQIKEVISESISILFMNED